MTDDLVERLRRDAAKARESYQKVFRVDEDLAEKAADCIEVLHKALLEIVFMDDVRVIQSNEHDEDLWRYKKIAIRALRYGRQQ